MQKGKYFLNTISVPGLLPGQSLMYAEETTLRNMRNYIPFRSMHVTNVNATCNVEVMFDYNPNKKIICLVRGIKDIKDQPFSSFSVKNLSAADTTLDGDVVLELETY
jgi:hypothetical protein